MYKYDFVCTICGKELTTGECRTKLGCKIRMKLKMREHYHTMAEVVFFQASGIYIPTAEKKWEKKEKR